MQIEERKLKMLYNIAIETSRIKLKFILGINEIELKKFNSAYLQGKPSVTVNGEKVIIEHPELVKIFDVSRAKNKYDSSSKIAIDFQNWSNTFNNKEINLTTLREFGEDVTSIYITGDWGVNASEIKNFGINQGVLNVVENINPNAGKIFISHSVKDAKIVQEFTEKILQIGLAINPSKEIFNISIEDAGIKTSEDFRNRIQNELIKSKAVIQIITENYKKSEACLNEMGAAWVLGIPVIPFILEPIEYESVGFIHNPKQLLKLNSKKDLKSFVAEYKGKLFSLDYNDSKLDRMIDEFLNILQVKPKAIISNTLPPTFGHKVAFPIFLDNEENLILNRLTIKIEDSPFFKVNDHANLYYCKNGKLHEIPDQITLRFLGVKKWNSFRNLKIDDEKYKKYFAEPFKSIRQSEVYVVEGNSRKWLIYNEKRHLITNDKTFEILTNNGKISFTIKAVTKEILGTFFQGDKIDFSL